MKIFLSLFTVLMLLSCGSTGKQQTPSAEAVDTLAVKAPEFNADSAFYYVERQVSFGPRVPGTPSHKACADYIHRILERNGADTIIEQLAEATAFNSDKLPVRNIMGRYNPGATTRILLVAHYDTRPWADNETDSRHHNTPIPGANDGGSGVGVMLEIARQMGKTRPDIGVDLLFVDAEDYGNSDGWSNQEDTWCLGTQEWVKNMPYGSDTKPRYGIVLDMVGGKGARFHREFSSDRNARSVNDHIWKVAHASGYSDIFVDQLGGGIVDDHIFIHRAGIPCIDIVENNNSRTGSFPPSWHTLGDDMNNIDRRTLKAVGQVVLNTIYNEKCLVLKKVDS